MAETDTDTEQLLQSVAAGERTAAERLLNRHRDRLKRMVAMRMDNRLKARVDPSDVVQEAMIVAANRLSQFAKDRPMPFYPWVRNLAWEQLVRMHEKHVQAAKRSVNREQQYRPGLSTDSVRLLANRLATSASGPADRLLKQEVRRRTRAALELLGPTDREILELCYLEQLDNDEIAAVLGIQNGAVRTRHYRAVRRLQQLLSGDSIGDVDH